MIKLATALLLLTVSFAPYADTPSKVVVASGGITEIIYQLGAEGVLAGVDTTSSYPESAQQLPSIGYMRAISAEGVLSLKPDLLLLSNEAGPKKVLDLLQQAGLTMQTVNSEHSVEGLIERVKQVAGLLAKQEKGDALVARLLQQQRELQQHIKGKTKPRVLFLLTHGGRSPMSAGHGTAADAVIGLAGAENVVKSFHGYRPLSQEAVAALQPDFIITTQQGLQQIGGADALLERAGIDLTPAAKNKQLIAMDAAYLLGFGPRVLEASLQLADQLHVGALAQHSYAQSE